MERKDIAEKYKWDLSSIIQNDEAFDALCLELEALLPAAEQFRGKLENADDLLACMKFSDDVSLRLENLYVYSRMKKDEDARVSKYVAMHDKARSLNVQLSLATAYILPELSSLSAQKLHDLSVNTILCDYSYTLEKLAKQKERVLSEKEEKIIAEFIEVTSGFEKAFTMFDDADIRFRKIKVDGKITEMSHGTYGMVLSSSDRNARKSAFMSMFNAFKDNINTITELYVGNIKATHVMAKLRKYDTCLDYAVAGEDVPSSIYYNLINATNANVSVLHDYIKYRKKMLGYSQIHSWDLHCPIIKDVELKMSYEEACELVKKALSPLGEEYAELLETAFTQKWIDVFENKGKHNGAYSWSTYSSHPYVLLNYQASTHDIFVIAHELGHAMHSFYSDKNQPYSKAGYEIFVAEVASTVNEMLLIRYLLKSASGDLKKYLLQYQLDMFRTTLFRQAMFAEFEVSAHDFVEKGVPITPELLCETYYNLNVKYYGKEVSDDIIRYEWARIPHFYRDYYVYKYSTGIISAVAISEDIFLGKEGALEGYKQFLSAGGSMPPNKILELAGVDLTTDIPFQKAMKCFRETLDEIVRL